MKNIVKCLLVLLGLIIFYTLIILYSPVGDFLKNKRAEVQYLNKIRKNPEDKNNYVMLNIIYSRRGEYDKALKIQKELIKNTEAGVNDYVFLADLFMKVDKDIGTYKDSAMKYLKEAQTCPDRSVSDLILIGNGYKRLREDSLAINAFEIALTKFSKDSAEYYNRLKKQVLNNIKAVKEIQKPQSKSFSKDTTYVTVLSKDSIEFIKVPPKNDSIE